MQSKINTIDDYIAQFPAEVQAKLQQLRQTIQAAAPEASEKISYQMPTFYFDGNLVHFAAYKTHIGFYPTPSGMRQLTPELERYRSGKATLRFPLNEPLPLDLITKVVQFRVEQNRTRQAKK